MPLARSSNLPIPPVISPAPLAQATQSPSLHLKLPNPSNPPNSPKPRRYDLDLAATPYRALRYHTQPLRGAAFHATYPLFATASDDGTAQVFHGRCAGGSRGVGLGSAAGPGTGRRGGAEHPPPPPPGPRPLRSLLKPGPPCSPPPNYNNQPTPGCTPT